MSLRMQLVPRECTQEACTPPLLKPHWHREVGTESTPPQCCQAGQAGQATSCPKGRAGAAIHTHLHNNVEGKVKKQVADANGQQIGSKVIGAHEEPIGSPGERGGLVTQGGCSPAPPLLL